MSCGTYSAKFETGSFCKKTTILRFSESSTKRSLTRSLLPIEVEQRRVVSKTYELRNFQAKDKLNNHFPFQGTKGVIVRLSANSK